MLFALIFMTENPAPVVCSCFKLVQCDGGLFHKCGMLYFVKCAPAGARARHLQAGVDEINAGRDVQLSMFMFVTSNIINRLAQQCYKISGIYIKFQASFKIP